MRKNLFLFLAALFFAATMVQAQNNVIVPLSGLKYFQEGISVKAAAVKIDGSLLLSNRIPVGKEVEISLTQPAGFTTDAAKTVFAGAEFSLLSPKGEVLATDANLWIKNQGTGFAAKDFAAPGIKFTILPAMTRGNFAATVKVRLYDLKSKNQLRFEFPVTFARPGEVVQVSKNSKPINSRTNAMSASNGLEIAGMQFAVDTTIRVNPKMAYGALDITGINGANMVDLLNGKESFWVYDKNLNDLHITDMLLKNVGGSLEGSKMNYNLKIPYRLKTAPATGYFIRFRWESADKKQVMDIILPQ